MRVLTLIKKSFLAGLLIGLGCIGLLTIENRTVAAFLFSFGLCSIFALKLCLFTGKVGYLDVFDPHDIFEKLVMLFTNCIGIGVVVIAAILMNESLVEKIPAAAAAKWSQPMTHYIIGGLVCGFIIHIALTSKNYLIIVGGVALFILIGSEHCIADFFYLPFAKLSYMARWGCVVLGNSFGAIFARELIGAEDPYEIAKNYFRRL